MTKINLAIGLPLKEGAYNNCTVEDIVANYDQDEVMILTSVDVKFNIEGHHISDRFFCPNDDRYLELAESMHAVTGTFELDTDDWTGMPCQLKIKNYVVNDRKFIHTFDWHWDANFFNAKQPMKTAAEEKDASGDEPKTLLAAMQAHPADPNEDPFKDVFKDGGAK